MLFGWTNVRALHFTLLYFALTVTLASDVGDVWETASEGFSSSLMGTSPGCSFADCATVRTCDNDDDNIVEHDGKSLWFLSRNVRSRRLEIFFHHTHIFPSPSLFRATFILVFY